MAIRNKLYSYSEAQGCFPFLYDEKANALYLLRGEKGNLFVIPIPRGGKVKGDIYLLEKRKEILLSPQAELILTIDSGILDLAVEDLIKREKIVDLKNLSPDRELRIVNTYQNEVLVTIFPKVPSSVYILTIQ